MDFRDQYNFTSISQREDFVDETRRKPNDGWLKDKGIKKKQNRIMHKKKEQKRGGTKPTLVGNSLDPTHYFILGITDEMKILHVARYAI